MKMHKNDEGKYVVDIYETPYIIDNMEDAIIAQNLWREIRSRYVKQKNDYHELNQLEKQLLTLLLKGRFDDFGEIN
jgi:hypothetical protein